MSSALASQLTQRFFRYLAITSQSDPRAATLPTTAGQHAMARALADELRQLGLDEIVIDEYATVTAVKRGNVAGAPRIGFITHIDTVDVGLSPDIHPQILRFTGEDLCLNREKEIWLRVAEHPEILAYPDEEIIFSDGTSVLLMATDYMSHFDRQQTPEHTAGREGYVWFNGIQGDQNSTLLQASIRDFDLESFTRRKQQIGEVAQKIAAQYPTGNVEYQVSDIYSNISNAVGEDRRAIDLLFEAMESLGITPKPTPMRGGTDGAALSAKGILTPNFFTGAHNFHSKFEFLPLRAFEASYQTALQLCLLAAR